ncbi:NAD-dependent epimerase/dehydratase family protein [Flavobacterium chungbukense]|uniref:NAD-dependent epimerase/dehydratase family protein n=1 Tax=Flavobacterium chungbukense TaxID=877464 RepID=A0ABP7XKT8_9FLAO|nr:NAD-dependent epimerase/dehydratase family protein [Flavobacterium chungbukense]MCC4922963.1 NAD-dependent epimerase/dehydratase family protein [Flavobacterium chungbukense]
MTILLTGANGFLGKEIIRIFDQKSNIITLSRSSGNYQLSLNKEVPEFSHHFDTVIHAAGKAHSVPKTEIEEREFYEVNVIGTENLLKALKRNGVPKQFVFISSVSVYGKDFGSEINEKCLLEANDAYGLSKIRAEKLVENWCKENNVICSILRLPLLVGTNPPGNLGAMIKAIRKGYYFNIDGGKARKSMVLAEDVAKFLINVSSEGGIYNLTDGVHPSFNELSLAIAKNENKSNPMSLSIRFAKTLGKLGDFFGSKAPINSLKVKKITSDLTFDDKKAKVELGWNPQSVISYIKKNKI